MTSSQYDETLRATLGRLVLFTVSLLGLLFLLQIEMHRLAREASPAWRVPMRALGELVICAAMWLAYVALVKGLERRRAEEIAVDRTGALVIAGALFGGGLIGAVYLILWAAGVATYAGWAGFGGVGPTAAAAVSAAVGEEIVFRGAVFRLLEARWGTLAGLLISGSLFGLLHAGNAGATLASSVAVALEGGVLLALAYTATRTLWLPIGIHFGWNFAEGGIFGAAVSGRIFHGTLSFTLRGPDILTGGSFGPEASGVSVAICLAASVLLAVIAIRRGRWRPRAARQADDPVRAP